jgi:tRNA pseudouridine38-40 synthase
VTGKIRIALGLEYDGTAFSGWQSQRSAPAVQTLVEAALSPVAAEIVSLICAGRTDAGVHACAQVAHFDTHARRSARGWVLGANTNLPADVSVAWARPVPQHFHARYSAEARTYRYYVFNRPVRSALSVRGAAWIRQPLDHERMQSATAALLGSHDFSAFRSAQSQSHTPTRRVEALAVRRDGDFVVMEITANAFLHHMVRNIAGLLIAIGQGDQDPSWAREVLESKDRTQGGPTAPAQGLYLWSVRYSRSFGLPAARSAMIAGLPVG